MKKVNLKNVSDIVLSKEVFEGEDNSVDVLASVAYILTLRHLERNENLVEENPMMTPDAFTTLVLHDLIHNLNVVYTDHAPTNMIDSGDILMLKDYLPEEEDSRMRYIDLESIGMEEMKVENSLFMNVYDTYKLSNSYVEKLSGLYDLDGFFRDLIKNIFIIDVIVKGDFEPTKAPITIQVNLIKFLLTKYNHEPFYDSLNESDILSIELTDSIRYMISFFMDLLMQHKKNPIQNSDGNLS